MGNESKDALATLMKLYAEIRAMQRFHDYLLLEILRDVAGNMPDRHAYLSGLFERVSARADQMPIESEAHPLVSGFRDAASNFFASVEKACGADKEEGNP